MTQFTAVLLLLQASAVFFLASGGLLRRAFGEEPKTTCGLRPVNPSLISKRIVNGHTPMYGSYPWQAGIRVIVEGEEYHNCGGTIINEYWILSAAHCFKSKKLSTVVVYVGDHDYNKTDPSEQRFEVEKLITHAMYNYITLDYDIALLKVKPKRGKGIQFDDYVQPACLPAPDTLYTEGKMCLISGWGRTIPEGSGSSVLQAADVPLLSDSQCRKTFLQISPREVCAGPVDSFGGICMGDSGGPLVCNEEDGYTVMGIVSSAHKTCGVKKTPSVFAKVTAFLSWIKGKMET